jgi:hypothetical protein
MEMPEIMAELNQTTAVTVVPARQRVCTLLSGITAGLESQGLSKPEPPIEWTGEVTISSLYDSQNSKTLQA